MPTYTAQEIMAMIWKLERRDLHLLLDMVREENKFYTISELCAIGEVLQFRFFLQS